jgi:methyltransferase (TIGR00027 family)
VADAGAPRRDVFEVDHPDSQRKKRERAAVLEAVARDVRFVGVDFERDDLEAALGAAGHDPDRRTTWVWEGVVMYLERRDIEATLAILQRRSAPGSRLVVVYNAPTWKVRIIGLLLRRLGEPFRSSFTAPQMRALLARHRFEVVADDDIPSLGVKLDPELVAGLQRMRHARVVVAHRTSA